MLNPLQIKLLDMLKWFHDFCVNNNIRYYVAYGTMLGAARHRGFIPWDDDIDVVVPRPDYEKLCGLLGDRQYEYFYLETVHSHNKDYLYGYAKLYDTRTTMIEHTRNDVVRGVFIDVFPLDGIGNNINEFKKQYKKIDVINMLLASRICAIRMERNFLKNLAIMLARVVPSVVFNEKKVLVYLDKLCSSYGYNQKYIANCMSTYRSRDIMKKEIFGNPTLYKFENIEVYGPENYDAYLEYLYHDWRKLPPIDKRHATHDFIGLDLNKSYLS